MHRSRRQGEEVHRRTPGVIRPAILLALILGGGPLTGDAGAQDKETGYFLPASQRASTIPDHGMGQGEYPFRPDGAYETKWVDSSARSKVKKSTTVKNAIPLTSPLHPFYRGPAPGPRRELASADRTPELVVAVQETPRIAMRDLAARDQAILQAAKRAQADVEQRSRSSAMRRTLPPPPREPTPVSLRKPARPAPEPEPEPELQWKREVPASRETSPPSPADDNREGFEVMGPGGRSVHISLPDISFPEVSLTEILRKLPLGSSSSSPAAPPQPAKADTPPQRKPVRTASPPAPAPARATFHRVTDGDTLWGISRKYGISVDQLKKINGLSNNVIRIGQSLRVTAP